MSMTVVDLLPWERPGAPAHVIARQPVMELPGVQGVRHDLPVRRPADELPRSLQQENFGIVVMSHRFSSNGRLSVLLSSIPANYPVVVSSDSVAKEDIQGDALVAEHHGADFRHCSPWGGRARNARHCMEVTTWRITLLLSDDVWLFPEACRDALRWFCTLERHGVFLGCLAVPGWETYRDHKLWGFDSWEQCLAEPWRFEAVPPNPAFRMCPALYKNPFGACMVMNRAAYDDVGGFAPEYWAHDDVFNHKIWLSKKWVSAAYPGRGYMHLGAQSWHHGESVKYVGSFKDATGLLAEESGDAQVVEMRVWEPIYAPVFRVLGGTPCV